VTRRERLAIIERDTTALLDGAEPRGAAALADVTDRVVEFVGGAESFEQVKALVRDPAWLTGSQAVEAYGSTVLAALVTGDLLARAHVYGEVVEAGIEVKPCARAFGGARFVFADPALTKLVAEPLAPEEAIRLFQSKVPLLRSAFDELTDAYKSRAFTIAYQDSIYAVDLVRAWLEECLVSGANLATFGKGLVEAAEAGGIARVNPFHAANVFRTNIQTAYNAGRWEMYHVDGLAEEFPLFEYHTVGDDRVRETHARMNGYVAPRNADVWRRWWPPCGYQCRCTVTAISKTEAERGGITASRRRVPEPDPGFAGNAALDGIARVN
jgi:SPP1 gp7 family putative phage head morphogenesis protein